MPLEFGLKFTADRDGFVNGVRFYKGASNNGTHVASLWSLTGDPLAHATFTAETASGWQQVLFSSPVAISAGTIYVVSYHSDGHVSLDLGYFAPPVTNPPLRAVSWENGNGVYWYGSSSVFPSASGNGANFWVDVVYTPKQ
jgi:hypothetical protein